MTIAVSSPHPSPCDTFMSIPAVFISIAIPSCVMSVAGLLLIGTSNGIVVTACTLLMVASMLGLRGFRQFLKTPASVPWEYGACGVILVMCSSIERSFRRMWKHAAP
ncbi:hypothetical protein [Pandoraea sp. NPDC090278]|uniref:hypothetical protein n=1 Tax=Pandoraea sp. NPDC090278 TaxID=3364391 RepID=UPI003839D7AE